MLQSILPELRKMARERGVRVVDRDPRWEASLQPGRAREILAEHMEALHGYLPVVVAILGDGHEGTQPDASEKADLPWLRDMGKGDDALLAIEFIECVIENQLMGNRAFFYIPEETATRNVEGVETSPIRKRIALVRKRVHDAGLAVRHGSGDPEVMRKQMLNDLLTILDRLFPSGENLSQLAQWRRSHELFAAPHRRAYEELPRYFDLLDAHARGDGPPIFITGEAGSGKTALLANWIAHHQGVVPEQPIIRHYVGALAMESGHTAMLRHLMAELGELCSITEPVPDDAKALVEAFPFWLAKGGDRGLILVIDGLDHLDPASHPLDWLPLDIPSNIRLIVSTTIGSDDTREIFHRLIDRDWKELPIIPLTLAQQRAIIGRIVADSGEELGLDLLQQIPLAGEIPTPLLIRMRFGLIQKTRTTIERGKLMATRTREEFFELMFAQLEAAYGPELVRDLLSLIRGARQGLSLPELEELTKADHDVISELLAAIDQYLVRRDDLLTFIHPYVRQAVEHRYLSERGSLKRIHRRLARYFASWPHSLRRAGEEPWQWEHAADRRSLATCLAEIPMFMLLSTDDLRHELRERWVYVNDEKMLIACYEESFREWRAHIPDEREHARVAERLGLFFAASGLLDTAESYLRLALALKREQYGERHRDTAVGLHQLAELLRQAGKYAEADEHYHSALAILEEEKETDQTMIARVSSDLGLLYRDSGQHQLALPFYLRAVELKERICGADHPSTAESLNDLALLYQDLKQFEMAIPLYRRAIKIRERRLGPNHPTVATSLSNLAGTLRDAGDLDEAEALYRRALQIRERMLGRNHPYTLIIVANLASLLQTLKKAPEARTMFERAIEGTASSLGPEHPNIIALSISYAYLLRDLKEYASAEELLRRILSIATRTLGDAHQYTALCRNNLARILALMNQNAEAASLLQQAIAAWKASLGNEHPYVVDSLERLAEILFEEGVLESARDCAEQTLKIRMRIYGQDHELTRRAIALLEKIIKAINGGSRDGGDSPE